MTKQERLFKHFLEMGMDEEDTYQIIVKTIDIAEMMYLGTEFTVYLEQFLNDWDDWAYRTWDWSKEAEDYYED